jgi:hypothetical protein
MLGLGLDWPVGDAQHWRLLAYGGNRDVLQFLAVPASAQANPLSGGGVVDLGSRFSGAEARWQGERDWAGGPLTATLGLAADQQVQHRLGFENFVGARTGVIGALRRDQRDTVSDLDAYAQLDWRPLPRLGLLVGAWATSGGRRKWRTRYNSELEQRRALEKTHQEREAHWTAREKEWREQDSLRAAAARDRVVERPVVAERRPGDIDGDGIVDANERTLAVVSARNLLRARKVSNLLMPEGSKVPHREFDPDRVVAGDKW